MDNFSGNKTTLLNELSGGNVEFGEAFAMFINDMVDQDGYQNPYAKTYFIMSPSWLKLANQDNKTKEDNDKLNEEFCETIRDTAKSYLLFIARETGNLTGKLDFTQYEKFMMKYRFNKDASRLQPEYLAEVKTKIRNAFNKIISHGEDDKLPEVKLLDKECMADFIAALMISVNLNKNDEFDGFKIEGSIVPREYVVNEHFLFEAGDNMFGAKLRIAHKMLNNQFE
ncbi:hypothetical protein IJ579_07730 [bacterium]|nr:hypothetical protein [bacterium]